MDNSQTSMYYAEELAIINELSKLSNIHDIMEWATTFGMSRHPVVLEYISLLQDCEWQFPNDDDVFEDDDAATNSVLYGAEDEIIMEEIKQFSSIPQIIYWARSFNILNHPIVVSTISKMKKCQTANEVCYCEKCGKPFSNKRLAEFHEKRCKKRKETCRHCTYEIKDKKDRDDHEKNCIMNPVSCLRFVCCICRAEFENEENLQHHFQIAHASRKRSRSPQPGPSGENKRRRTENTGFCCRLCKQAFYNRRALYLHQKLRHQKGNGSVLQKRPWSIDPWLEEGGKVDATFRDVYTANESFILKNHESGSMTETFNLPLNNHVQTDVLLSFIQDIYQSQDNSFKLNIMVGMILRHVETGDLRYFIPDTNNSVFDSPFLIHSSKDFLKLQRMLNEFNFQEHILQQRTDSKWRPFFITNVKVIIFKSNFRLGCKDTDIPNYIIQNKNIITLLQNTNGKKYDDNLCLFRCLAVHKKQKKEETVRHYFQQWCKFLELNKRSVPNLQDFSGLDLLDLPLFEECFSINIFVYSLQADGSAKVCFRSLNQFLDTMYCNMFDKHMSYISNINSFSSSYQCPICEKFFNNRSNLKRHSKNCQNKTKFIFPGGYYDNSKSVFDRLEEYGYIVPKSDRFFPWFIVFDFEALLVKLKTGSQNLKWTTEHIPVSVSVCSNIPGHCNPQCIVDEDPEVLVSSMVNEMEKIGISAGEKMEGVLKDAFSYLQEEIRTWESFLNEKDPNCPAKKMVNALKSISGSLYHYCHQVPVLGFNSSKYDLNLIKKYIAKYMNMDESKTSGITIKQNNSYTCISNDKLKFLDISHFLAPGTSYQQFLKAYGVNENKGFFPYEYLDSFTKLNENKLPPYEAFFSTLKERNISMEEYHFCMDVWKKEGMHTLKDFLIWYNNLDVGPMVQAVTNLQQFYFKKGIDLFKVAVSTPGIARKLLFETGLQAGARFGLFGDKDSDLFFTVKKNIVGGPSIIFNRFSKVGESFIRNNPDKPCQKVLGYDANALYLWAIGQEMPTGTYIRRRKENNFKPEKRDKFLSAFYWLEWVSQTTKKHIIHKMNYGREKRIGPYPVDGFCAENRTVFQFNGCYWHGHDCILTKHVDKKLLKERQQNTDRCRSFIQSKGYKIEEMKECQFLSMQKTNKELKDFISSKQPMFYQQHKGEVSNHNILKGVEDETLFGMVEVDIEVPGEWQGNFKSDLSPFQYFSEMSPIFCSTQIPFNSIGSHMQKHVFEHNLSTKPRKLLVGGMRAKKILLATPLLKWYLKHGLQVTNIYQVVEYVPMKCFESFVNQVTLARREGDNDPDKAVIANTSKLIGNSGYGSLIMDKTKHRNIFYVQGKEAASKAVNSNQFRNLNEINNDFYEVEMAKQSINFNLPIQLGYFILQYAKLRMLAFYYDFLDVYVDRSDFQYCEMDTDSAYMAISGQSLNDIIKPKMKSKFFNSLNGFCFARELDPEKHWFPRECCNKHSKMDKRTPGLFKLEYSGNEIICLCSKSYAVRDGEDLKFSAKGVQKLRLRNPYTIFESVLETQNSAITISKGFRVKDNSIQTYEQSKRGFTYFYCKRVVLENGIDTVPLDIVLSPHD